MAPILQQVNGFDASMVGVIILVYGVSVAIGNLYGGKLADRKGLISALTFVFSGLALVLLLLSFVAGSKLAVLITVLITVLVWGSFAFGNVSGLQVYVVQLAQKYTPNAMDVASGLNIAAFNVGIALGSLSGRVIVETAQLTDTAWVEHCRCGVSFNAFRWRIG
nr:MFS transporter [Thalassotalea sp. Y01]